MEAFFVIAFREGLEAFLVLGIVLAFLQKKNLIGIKKYAWLGLVIGILCSLFLGFIFTVVVDGFESEELQYDISLGVLLVAIVMLTYLIFWMQHHSTTPEIQNKIEQSTNQKLVTFFIVFFALFREGFETVLFSLALLMSNDVTVSEGMFGLSLGFISSGLFTWGLFTGAIKLSLKKFFTYSTYLLLFIVAGLFSLFLKGMQAAEYLPHFYMPLFNVSYIISNDSAIGKMLSALFGYDAMPSLMQVASWVVYLSIIFVFLSWRKVRA